MGESSVSDGKSNRLGLSHDNSPYHGIEMRSGLPSGIIDGQLFSACWVFVVLGNNPDFMVGHCHFMWDMILLLWSHPHYMYTH